MKSNESFSKVIARHLVNHAVHVMPGDRREWAQAMRNEINHLPIGMNAIRWAIGCVIASHKERMAVMKLGNLKVSRLVLSFEMLMCFGIHTFLLLYIFFSPIFRPSLFSPMVLSLIPFLVGPIGLIFAFRIIVLKHTSMSRIMLAALCILAIWTVTAISIQLLNVYGTHTTNTEWLGFIYLYFAILPAFGTAHLVYIANPKMKTLTAG